jgi:hypothetical protein
VLSFREGETPETAERSRFPRPPKGSPKSITRPATVNYAPFGLLGIVCPPIDISRFRPSASSQACRFTQEFLEYLFIMLLRGAEAQGQLVTRGHQL